VLTWPDFEVGEYDGTTKYYVAHAEKSLMMYGKDYFSYTKYLERVIMYRSFLYEGLLKGKICDIAETDEWGQKYNACNPLIPSLGTNLGSGLKKGDAIKGSIKPIFAGVPYYDVGNEGEVGVWKIIPEDTGEYNIVPNWVLPENSPVTMEDILSV